MEREISQPELDRAAQGMYDEMLSVKPTWDQLTEVTKNYWRDKALARLSEGEDHD